MENNNLGFFIQDLIDDAKDAILGNERQSDLQQVAEKQGFRYKKKFQNDRLDIEIKAFDLFKGKKRKRLKNYLSKKDDTINGQISLFDFNKDSDVGKKITTCVLIQSAYLNLPKFIVRPKKTTEKLSEFFLSKEVGLVGFPFFNRKYAIRCLDLEAIQHLFTQQLVNLMVNDKNLWLEGNEDYLLLYEKNKLKSPETLIPFYDFGREMVDIMLYDNSDDFV